VTETKTPTFRVEGAKISHRNKERLDPGVFDVAVTDIRMGYRSAVYFNRAKAIMQAEKPEAVVTVQVFQKGNASILCGVDEAIAILKSCTGYFTEPETARQLFDLILHARRSLRQERPGIWRQGHHGITQDISAKTAYKNNLGDLADLEQRLDGLWVPGWDKIEVKALYDGDVVFPYEPVMTITGPYYLFAHLESVYLGILARQTKIATNTHRVTSAANHKPVLFFADRFDHYATQGGDGYAAKVGGAESVASDAMAAWWGDRGQGTMPHALIAAYGGNVCEASAAFHEHFPRTNLIALVDFNNDSVADAVACAKRFGQDLWGVRLDTSENMVDASITADDMGEVRPTGVNPTLVGKVRGALDTAGFSHVKIIVSGGFNADKIREFEARRVPVDVYAVGSSLLQGSNDFTADVVSPVAKKGRWARNPGQLERVT
jgi:nicotinate phosphoribosyltransferase